ncbi:MAG: MGMT family protein [Ruminococcaceae bacterium]|nr:MGMT family protein [Oscillospiraceae bacterium]
MKHKVYKYLCRIPRGKVVTYSQIASHLGNPKLARAVGNILHQNPDGEHIPCYKVVNCKGKLSTNYAFGGMEAQKHRLASEGIEVINGKVDLLKYQYKEENKP